jgi:dolichol-phosphate mannosyltransferase
VVSQGKRELTVVIPTYNESPNLAALFQQFALLRSTWRPSIDLLIVDDDSPDGTSRIAAELGAQAGVPTQVLVRHGRRSMGAAIVEGLRQCDTDLVCVMDADLSHPPSLLPLMLERLNGFDGVVASRYAAGGRIPHWPAHRRIISLVARAIAQGVIRTPSTDPLSGFFLLRRASIEAIPLTGLGHKPLFEILAQAELTVYEVPYVFRNRENGRSKLGTRAVLEYLRLTMSLWQRRVRTQHRPGLPEEVAPESPRDL